MVTTDIIQLTRSKTREAILRLFFNSPRKEYYLRQIERLLGYSAGNIRRELIKLEKSGLFTYRMLGKVRLFRLNTGYPLYYELKNIIRKTVGIEGELKNIITAHKDIDFAFVYGSFAKGKEKDTSDIDIIIIGNISPKEIKTQLFEYQSKITREINSTVYTKEEFMQRLKKKEHFVSSIAKENKILLKGDPDEFERFIQLRKIKKT